MLLFYAWRRDGCRGLMSTDGNAVIHITTELRDGKTMGYTLITIVDVGVHKIFFELEMLKML